MSEYDKSVERFASTFREKGWFVKTHFELPGFGVIDLRVVKDETVKLAQVFPIAEDPSVVDNADRTLRKWCNENSLSVSVETVYEGKPYDFSGPLNFL